MTEGSAIVALEKRTDKKLDDLRDENTAFRREVMSAISDLSNKVSAISSGMGKTNWVALGTMGAVLLGIGGWASNGFSKEMDRIDRQAESGEKRTADLYKELDTKLQRESLLMVTQVKDAVDNVDKRSLERHNSSDTMDAKILDRIHRLEDWTNAQISAELEELRIRRMNH